MPRSWRRRELNAVAGAETIRARPLSFLETAPYRRGKVARYYLAETSRNAITLPISPELGIPEHHEWRWVSFDQAEQLLPPRLQPILDWARRQFQG